MLVEYDEKTGKILNIIFGNQNLIKTSNKITEIPNDTKINRNSKVSFDTDGAPIGIDGVKFSQYTITELNANAEFLLEQI